MLQFKYVFSYGEGRIVLNFSEYQTHLYNNSAHLLPENVHVFLSRVDDCVYINTVCLSQKYSFVSLFKKAFSVYSRRYPRYIHIVCKRELIWVVGQSIFHFLKAVYKPASSGGIHLRQELSVLQQHPFGFA